MNLVEKLIRLDRECRKTVGVIGDGLKDVYILGEAQNCQDGCVNFVRNPSNEKIYCSGGALNAAYSLRHWNAAVHSVAPIMELKNRYVDNSGKIFFRIDERTPELKFSHASAISEATTADAVLLSDYDKGFLTPDLIRQVADICKRRGVPCVADAKREPKTYEGCILKCNADYIKKVENGVDFGFEVSPAFIDNYVITHGFDYPAVCQNGNMCHRPFKRPFDVGCKSHIGAGDAFAAHMTLALAHGFSLEDAAAVAHSAGRVYVQRLWNQPPRPEEIARDFAGEAAIVE